MFLSLRSDHISKNPEYLNRYAGLLRYEALGSSKLLSLYALPPGCDTVFFPGCNLPGTRAAVTERLFLEMAERMPRLGLVLDCCNKPSHDLGREDFFRAEFGRKTAKVTVRRCQENYHGLPKLSLCVHQVCRRHGCGFRLQCNGGEGDDARPFPE